MDKAKPNDDQLQDYKLEILQGRMDKIESLQERDHAELEKLKINVAVLVFKVALAGSVLGSFGMFLLQKLWK